MGYFTDLINPSSFSEKKSLVADAIFPMLLRLVGTWWVLCIGSEGEGWGCAAVTESDIIRIYGCE